LAKYALQEGFVQNHDLNLSGGTDQTQYGLGLSYLSQEGIIPLVDFSRFSLRATIDQKIGKESKDRVEYNEYPELY
jgi:hypothetical protein